MRSRFALAALLAASVGASSPEAASVHVRLLRSEPRADTTLAAAPAVLRLWFSQRPELGVTSVRLTGSGDQGVELGPLRIEDSDGSPVAADIRGALADGRYAVRWRTMSPDGHPVNGRFAFAVAARAPAP